ncbi:MAG: hypothetical protein PHS59_04325 [Paludibacter sp.]|nr:hypothetical protein [Paludibacter sp.]
MKTNLSFFISFVFSFILFNSCDFISDLQENSSRISFKAKAISDKSGNTDTIVFTSKEIKCYNDSTHEIIFNDSVPLKTISKYGRITCYLDADSLFTATQTSDIMSFIVNDLVLNHNLYDGKYYFDDGYPGWIDNVGATTLRAQNKAKRADAWAKFIAQLKLEGKYKSN